MFAFKGRTRCTICEYVVVIFLKYEGIPISSPIKKIRHPLGSLHTEDMSSPPPGTQSGLAEPFNTLYKILIEPAQERFADLSMFSPAIFTLGSLFVSFITLNYPIFLFSIASGEALLIQNGLRGVSSYLNTVESVQEARTLGKSEKCKSRYEGSESTKFKYLLDNGISDVSECGTILCIIRISLLHSINVTLHTGVR